MPESALSHIKVLDLTHHISGPYATKLLTNLGAQVIKVERPALGDPSRALGPFVGDDPHPEKSLPFLYLNTGKRGVTLDLTNDAGRTLLHELVRWADLVVVNFSPATLDKLGLDYESLAAVKPSPIIVSITNFGLDGPYRNYQAWDIVEYALGGLMYIFGTHDREPVSHALYQAQYRAGTVAAGAAQIALYGKQMAGVAGESNGSSGNLVDISIMEVIAASLRDTVSQYTYQGIVRRRGPRFGMGMGRSMATKDGYIIPVMGLGPDWEAFSDFLGAPELKDERFTTQENRIRHARELDEILSRRFQKYTKLQLFHDAHSWRFHFGVVLSPREVTESDQLRERGYFVELDHPVAGRLTYPGASAIFSETPWQAVGPAPTLGQHNREVFSDLLGYSKDDLIRLRQIGAI